MAHAGTTQPGLVERMAPLSGVAFAVLAIVAVALWGDIAEPGEEAREMAAFYVDDPAMVLGGAQVLALAAFAVVWFGGSLRAAIARAEGAGQRLAGLAAAGAAAVGALMLASVAVNGAIGLRADELGRVDAETAAIVGDVATLLLGAAAPVAMAVVAAATGIAAIRARAILPVWLGWVSVVLAVGLVILPINYMVVLGFLAWSIVVGILLFMEQAPADRAAA